MRIINELVVRDNSIGIFWIGQGGFVFKTPQGKVVFVDPYLSDSVEKKGKLTRLQEIPLKPEEVKADFILSSDQRRMVTGEDLIKLATMLVFFGP